jgi:hypothetical protein
MNTTAAAIAAALTFTWLGMVLAISFLEASLKFRALIRPVLTRRSDLVLGGAEVPRSRAHLWYVAAESVKVIALIALGVSVLAR